MPKPLSLPFDPIARADALWTQRWGSAPSMAAITSIMRAHQILLAQVDAVVKPYGLTFARYEALVLLTFARRGELPMSKIGERLMVHPTSVTNTVDRLERSGLVSRRPNPKDGRGTLASITDRGREACDAATRDLMAMDFGLGAYGEEECAAIFALLRPLRVAAEDFERPRPLPGARRERAGTGHARGHAAVPGPYEVSVKKSVLTRYRVMAYVTAVMLLLLCACMVAKYGFETGEGVTLAVSQAHGGSTSSTSCAPSTWARRPAGRSAGCCGCWSPAPSRRPPSSWSARSRGTGAAGRRQPRRPAAPRRPGRVDGPRRAARSGRGGPRAVRLPVPVAAVCAVVPPGDGGSPGAHGGRT